MRAHIKEALKSELLARYKGNSTVTVEFPAQTISNAEKLTFHDGIMVIASLENMGLP